MSENNKLEDDINDVDIEVDYGLVALEDDYIKGDEKKVKYLPDLKIDDPPLVPLPEDTMGEIKYAIFYEKKCNLCTSPFRQRAEHVYLESGKKKNRVTVFFAHHFGVRVNYECISSHMENHCDFTKITTSGLKTLSNRDEEFSLWRYRERDLAITGLLTEVDDLRGLDLTKKPDMALKRAVILTKIYGDLSRIQKERDEVGSANINIFKVLLEIHDSLPHDTCKQIVVNAVQKLRKEISIQAEQGN